MNTYFSGMNTHYKNVNALDISNFITHIRYYASGNRTINCPPSIPN